MRQISQFQNTMMRGISLNQKRRNEQFNLQNRTFSQIPSYYRNIPEFIYTRDRLTKNYVQKLLSKFEKEILLIKQVYKRQIEAEKTFKKLNKYAMHIMDKLGLYEQSIQIFCWIVKHKSSLNTPNIYCLVYANLGSLHFKKGDTQQAVIALNEAFILSQECDVSTKTYLKIANSLIQMNMNEKATQVLIKAIESGEKNFDSHNKELVMDLVVVYIKYAIQLEQLNKVEEALIQYQNGINMASKHIEKNNPLFQQFQSQNQEALERLNNLYKAKLQQKRRFTMKINIKDDESKQEKKVMTYQTNKYQIIGQEGNNISQLEQMIYLQNVIIEKFKNFAEQNNLSFEIDWKQFQYTINPKTKTEQIKADKLFCKFKVTLDHLIILTIKFDSFDEMTKNQRLLSQSRIKKQLIQQLNIKKFQLLMSSDISLEGLQENEILLINQAYQLKNNSYQIILICYSKQFLDIKRLQEQLNVFVQQSNKFKLIEEQFQIDLVFAPDENYVQQKVKRLQDYEEWQEIIVSKPTLKIENKKKFIIEVTIQIWIQEENMIYEGYQEGIQRLKNEIMLIFFPIKQIIVIDKSKIMLWEQFLFQFYINNSLDCWTIRKNPSQMIIELQGESQMINDKYLQIESDLNEFSCETLSFICQEQIIKILHKKQKLENLYKSSFANIANQFGKCLIKISGVDVNKSTILVTIFHHIDSNLQLIKQLLEEQFFAQLNFHNEKNFEIEDLCQFLGMEKQIFFEQHKIVVSKINKESFFVGLNINLMEIKKLLTEIKKYHSENQKTKIIDCPKILIFNILKQQFFETELQKEYDQNVQVNYSQELKIILRARDQLQLDEKYNSISEEIKQLEKKTVSKICIFQEKQTKYFEKHLKSFQKQLEKQNNIIFEFDQKFVYQILSQLEYGNKKIQVVSTNITLIECDAIVNFSNHIAGQSKKLNQHILDFGGQTYQKFIENVIQSTQQQNQIEVTVFELSQFRNIRYIINVFIPLDANRNQALYGQQLQKNIDALFDKIENNNYHIQTLIIPTLIGEDNIKIDDYITYIYLDGIINRFFKSNNLIKKIILNEPNYLQIDQLNLNFQRKLSGQQNKSKFQWQWKNDNKFENYPFDINLQIDNGYKQFLQSNQEIIVMLNYQITSLPSTHFVNLQDSTIQELSSKQVSTLTFKLNGYNKKYYINNEYVKDPLNNYFVIQEQNKNFQFYIFWKQLDVIFNSEGANQINRITKYKRELQKIPILNQDNVLVGQNYSFKTNNNEKIENSNSFLIQSFDQKLNEKTLKEIKTVLKKYLTNLDIQIPHIRDQDLEKFSNFLEAVTQRFQGQIIQGQKIQIEIFQNKERKVQAQIESIMNYVKQYPKKWIKQSDNFIKVLLQQNSKEFQKIQQNFKQTQNKKIQAIYRIQNQFLWDNYIQERNKLFGIYKNQKNILNKIEQKRYLWHGVRGQHPSVIYNSQKEAFDVTFSNSGMWGDGIYFAQNAAYSNSYSYQITQQDDPNYVGMHVMLYCLVTTGKVQQTAENNTIRRPGQGYDSVTGWTNGSQIYILYKMDVRRAYPAYEVIYQ